MSRESVKLTENPKFYTKHNSGYFSDAKELIIFRPTFSGLKVLTHYYREKYGVKINLFENEIGGNSLAALLQDERKKEELKSKLKEGHTEGYLLYHPLHSIAVIFFLGEGSSFNIAIFESMNADSIYDGIAKEHPDFNFLVNYGPSRQCSSLLCEIDAITILKDSLQRNDLGKLIESRIIREEEGEEEEKENLDLEIITKTVTLGEKVGSLRRSLKLPDSFTGVRIESEKIKFLSYFLMPEILLKTTENRNSFEKSEPELETDISRKDKPSQTLAQKREKHQTPKLITSLGKEISPANIFLFQKSLEIARKINYFTNPRTTISPDKTKALVDKDRSMMK